MSRYRPGVWEGHRTVDGRRVQLAIENMRIEFSRSREGATTTATGNGVDADGGSFTFHGTFGEKPPFKCEFALRFDAAGATELKCEGFGESSKGGVFGEAVEGGTGGVSMHPVSGDSASSLVAGILEKLHAERREALVGMGFDDSVISKALAATQSTEEAIQWAVEHPEAGQFEEFGGDSPVIPPDQLEEPQTTFEVREEDVLQLAGLGFDAEEARGALRIAVRSSHTFLVFVIYVALSLFVLLTLVSPL
jgi:UBA-like domain